MTIQEIFDKAIEMGVASDFRTKEQIDRVLERKKKKYDKLSDEEKEEFDTESLTNPYSDSRILHVAEDKDIKKVLVGIDIDPAEILMAKHLGDIDLVISHHPIGRALADLHEVMDLQVDILNQYGVPVNVAEGLMKERISEISRKTHPGNNWAAVDAAKLLGVNLICLHTAADNNAAKFLKDKIENTDIEYVSDLMKILRGIEEYKMAVKMGSGPRVFAGSPENRAGKIALTELTGGTEGSPKLFEKIADAGIGTVVGMHISEDHKKEADSANLNVVIAGHMSSDSIGMNLILDELEKKNIEIVPCSGLLRVSRV
ncbi:MAG TPA: NGG1p interacting factor NIF3 [Candidatus Wildermuthbacteria bacterium]|nr:Nif3-like dinuclear metal center hexameric protein [Patescibacteria group bacterium]HEA84460.1 NGG1p interacting factor NIF3 [Candidatus Wildermuthbacteria bacterium]